MTKLGTVEDTLFIPMLGRIYAAENCPQVLSDEKALSLKKKLPDRIQRKKRQRPYTLLASASRSANMDRFIRDFLSRKTNGVIVQLGCGLETTYYRIDNGRTLWYAVDLPHVINYRKTLLPQPEREIYLAGDAFEKGWMDRIRADVGDAPLMITAGGLFHYFREEKVIALLQNLSDSGETEAVFDAVSKRGRKMMERKYMKELGYGDVRMFFYVDSAEKLADRIGSHTKVLAEEPYYACIPRKGLPVSAGISMNISDRFHMLKMIHLKLQKN